MSYMYPEYWQIISENVHDSDTEKNENMVHWVQLFVMGQISENKIKEIFKKGYEEDSFIEAPWS